MLQDNKYATVKKPGYVTVGQSKQSVHNHRDFRDSMASRGAKFTSTECDMQRSHLTYKEIFGDDLNHAKNIAIRCHMHT